MLHAVALQLGSIALVQPLMLAGVVLAVPVRAGLERKRWFVAIAVLGALNCGLLGVLVYVVAGPRPSARTNATTPAAAVTAASAS